MVDTQPSKFTYLIYFSNSIGCAAVTFINLKSNYYDVSVQISVMQVVSVNVLAVS